MPDISSIGQGSVGPIDRTARTLSNNTSRSISSTASREGESGDRVELSEHSRLMNRLRSLPDVRQALINEVRQAIADGTYETDGKLNEALEGLMEDLG